MKELKINDKTTKKELFDYLKESLATAEITDQNLIDRIGYAVRMFKKDQTKVTKDDLIDLVNEISKYSVSADESEEVAPKSSKKTLTPKKSKKVTKAEPAEEPEEPEEAEEDSKEDVEEKPVQPKKSKEKTSLKKSTKATKKEDVDTLPPASNVGIDNLPSAKMFPAEIDHPELGKIVACTGAYTTYAEILKALDEEKTLYFACYWTKRQIREFQYAASKQINPDTVKNGFLYDLDIAMAVLPCETMERIFAMSRITEALYQFEGEDFKPIEDVDPRSGEKFQVRVSAGMEFEIYRPADEEIVTL